MTRISWGKAEQDGRDSMGPTVRRLLRVENFVKMKLTSSGTDQRAHLPCW